jgi:hypothetical protein
MDDITDDDLFLDAVDAILLDAPQRLRRDPEERYGLFKVLVVAAQAVVAQHAPESG